MKKIALALITFLLFGATTIKAQEEKLSSSEPISSGCLSHVRGDVAPILPTITLTKEGNILSVDLFNYSSNCGTTSFEVENRMIDDNNDNPSVIINVIPVVPVTMDCTCPFNISYTVRGLEENNFYLTCWWYEGQVELTEGEPLVLECKTEDVVINDLRYQLLKTTHQAKLLYQFQWNEETEIQQIPSEVEYEGEKYTVTSINEFAFKSNTSITKIIIPKTVKNTEFASLEGFTRYPFSGCLSLETIEVEEGNPAICSVDGVLFNKNKTTLIGYPAASPREFYNVPDGVKTAVRGAFSGSQNLKKIVLTDNMETLDIGVFSDSSLKEVIFQSSIKEFPSYLFYNCKKLESVDIPEGVTSIGSSAFEGCSSLESISMPESVTTVYAAAFMGCTLLKSATLSPNLKEISLSMFRDCSKLTEVIIPFGITTIGYGAFSGCKAMQSIDLPESINYIDGFAFYPTNLKDIYCHAKTVPNTNNDAFRDVQLSQITLHVPASAINDYQSSSPWNQFGAIVPLETQDDYHPFIEEGKVWKLGGRGSANPVQLVEYYYFDGDTIINGKTCKQMMCQRYVSPDHPDYEAFAKIPSLRNVGAWYEEDKKVYTYDTINKQFKIKYDFSLGDNETMLIEDYPYVIGPKQTGGLKGFKGVYRDVMWYSNDADPAYCTTWLEGVGGIDGPITNVYLGKEYYAMFMMSCTVGDEVIYLNDEYEDGATPERARKKRFDFTHTVKIQPKSRVKSGERLRAGDASAEKEQPLYGEYNDLQLGINLNPIDDAYQVRIADETGKAVYEKDINAATIVGLNIDISAYAAGRYIVTVENSLESFTGEFDTQTTGISDAARLNDKEEMINDKTIYNLQGQRLSSLQKGLNIVNGQKIYVK